MLTLNRNDVPAEIRITHQRLTAGEAAIRIDAKIVGGVAFFASWIMPQSVHSKSHIAF